MLIAFPGEADISGGERKGSDKWRVGQRDRRDGPAELPVGWPLRLEQRNPLFELLDDLERFGDVLVRRQFVVR